jgi:hypothetical protein
MAPRTQVYQVFPWTGGINRTVDPGLLPKEALVQADNVVFATTGARIKRSAHAYLDPDIDSFGEGFTFSLVPVTQAEGTTRRLALIDTASTDPATVQTSSRDVFAVGEHFTFSSDNAAVQAYYGTGPHKITAIDDDEIEFVVADSAEYPADVTGTHAAERAGTNIGMFDFWHFDLSTNGKVQKIVTVQLTPDQKLLYFYHTPSAGYTRKNIQARSSQIEVATFDGSDNGIVDASDDEITATAHGFETGDRVVYGDGGGSAIAGLTSGATYYIIKVSDNVVQLAKSYTDALFEVAIDLTAEGTGTSHTLTPATLDSTVTIGAGVTPRVNFLPFNERLIISFDTYGLVPRVFDPNEEFYRLVEGDPPDFFTANTFYDRIITNDKNFVDRVHFSETGNGDVWQGDRDSGAIDIYLGDGDRDGITAIFPAFRDRLFVSKRDRLYAVEGDSPENFRVRSVSGGLGCVGPHGIVALDMDDMIFVSDKGVHSLAATEKFGDFEGQFLSKNIQPIFDKELNRARLQRIRGHYIPSLNSVAFSVAREQADTSETAFLMYNFEQGEWYEWPDLEINCSCIALIGNDKKLLYSRGSSRLVETQTPGFSDFGVDPILYRIKTGAHYPGQNPKKLVYFHKLTLYYKPEGRFSFTLRLKIDNHEAQLLTFTQQEAGTPLGAEFILGQAALGSSGVMQPFTKEVAGIGRGVSLEIEQSGLEEQIEVYGFDLEYWDAGFRNESINSDGTGV